MDAFLQDGDFDFGVFASTSETPEAPPAAPKPNLKRKQREERQEYAAKKNRYDTKSAGGDGKQDGDNEKGESEDKEGGETKNKPLGGPIKWDYNPKVAWEPDAADIANMISIEKTDSMFQGEFSDTGLSDRVVSLLLSMFLHFYL